MGLSEQSAMRGVKCAACTVCNCASVLQVLNSWGAFRCVWSRQSAWSALHSALGAKCAVRSVQSAQLNSGPHRSNGSGAGEVRTVEYGI